MNNQMNGQMNGQMNPQMNGPMCDGMMQPMNGMMNGMNMSTNGQWVQTPQGPMMVMWTGDSNGSVILQTPDGNQMMGQTMQMPDGTCCVGMMMPVQQQQQQMMNGPMPEEGPEDTPLPPALSSKPSSPTKMPQTPEMTPETPPDVELPPLEEPTWEVRIRTAGGAESVAGPRWVACAMVSQLEFVHPETRAPLRQRAPRLRARAGGVQELGRRRGARGPAG